MGEGGGSIFSDLYDNAEIDVKKIIHKDIPGCSASRGMRQTFSCLSKLVGTTNLIRFLFGHVK